jgi:hypothetical protein
MKSFNKDDKIKTKKEIEQPEGTDYPLDANSEGIYVEWNDTNPSFPHVVKFPNLYGNECFVLADDEIDKV